MNETSGFIKHGWLENPRTEWSFEWENHFGVFGDQSWGSAFFLFNGNMNSLVITRVGGAGTLETLGIIPAKWAPKIAKLVYSFNNHGLWYIYIYIIIVRLGYKSTYS